jgi:hypothetical protein
MTAMFDIACVAAGPSPCAAFSRSQADRSPVRVKRMLNRNNLIRISAQGRVSGGAELLPVRH